MTASSSPTSPGSPVAPIDFWFDFASPYGYFMAEKIDAVAARHGRRVRWRPVLLFAVLRALDMPAPLQHEVKRDYMLADFERSARFLGLPFRLPVGFPAVSQQAARAFYLLEQQDVQGAIAFARRTMRGYFTGDASLEDVRRIAQWACEADASVGKAEVFAERLRGDEARVFLARAVDEAVHARVFGSPMVVIDGERFFGVDRLPQIEARLAGGL